MGTIQPQAGRDHSGTSHSIEKQKKTARWKNWLSIGASIVLALCIAAALLVPWSQFDNDLLYLSLVLVAMIVGFILVLVSPGIFHNGASMLISMLMVVVPVVWVWPFETVVVDAHSQVPILPMPYATMLLIMVGMVTFPPSLIRTLWRQDTTCLVIIVTFALGFVSVISFLEYATQQEAPMELLVQLQAVRIGIMTTSMILILILAGVMFVVNLVRLIWQECRPCRKGTTRE